jgi:hypothetical protein
MKKISGFGMKSSVGLIGLDGIFMVNQVVVIRIRGKGKNRERKNSIKIIIHHNNKKDKS